MSKQTRKAITIGRRSGGIDVSANLVGAAGTITANIGTGLGTTVNSASVRIGENTYPMTLVAGRTYRYTFDTIRYQADVGTPSRELTISDVWVDYQVTAIIDGVTYQSAWAREITQNDTGTVGGATSSPTAWSANYTTLQNYWTSHTSVYGKEQGALQLVPDPLGIKSGLVVKSNVPNNYPANTAGTVSTYSGGTYGSGGDQPSTGSLRFQAETLQSFGEGKVVFFGYSVMLDAGFPTPVNSQISIDQIYGAPFDWGLLHQLVARQNVHPDAEPDTWIYWGERLNPYERQALFKMPFRRSQWVDVVYGVRFSQDGRVGWIEIWTAQPGINGGALTQHVFPSGHARLPAVTLPKTTDGSSPAHRFHIQVYRSATAFSVPVIAYFANEKVGSSAAAVDPHTYPLEPHNLGADALGSFILGA